MIQGLWMFIDGHKLYLGGTLMLLSGLSKIGLSLLNGQPVADIDVQLVMAGWLAIGGKSGLKKLQPGG